MSGIEDLTVFLIAGLTLNVIPGPDTMYIVAQSVAQGRQAGVWTVLGISSGSFVHTLAAAFGLSAILASSVLAFSIVKWAGAIYLVYLGIRLLSRRASDRNIAAGLVGRMNRVALFRRGMLTNLLNPKVALFYLSFLPQFVSPEYAGSPWPYLFLGCVFISTGTVWCLLVVTMAGGISGSLRTDERSRRLVERITGVVFIALGLRLATQQAE